MKKLPLFFLILLNLTACTFIQPDTGSTTWWEDAVFYEIFVRSFNDSDCDGIGDFNGITEKLDYLQELGVNALWLMPIYPSPSYHGYDVTDYYTVNPEYGTLEDFQTLVDEAHQRDIRIIIDMVLNHTSNQHPWFIDAETNPGSPYRDWYIWSEEDPGYQGPLGAAWHPSSSGYYYGVFWSGMPDLNQANPEVTAEMKEISKFWLNEIGVDGFRVDAAKHLIEEGQNQENTASTHAWLQDYYSFYKAENPAAYTVGEIYGAGAAFALTYTGDQFDQVFNFEMGYGFINSANNGSNYAVNSAVTFSLKDMPAGNYATFLTNHDQDRVMNVLGGDVNKAKLAASLLLTAQGTPFIYYGEEIGMQGRKPDEDIRRPMQWSGEANAGFACPEAAPWRPPHEDYSVVNVSAQQGDAASLLSHYQTLIEIRKAHPALRTGAATLVDTSQKEIYAILRTTDKEKILVVINLSAAPVNTYTLSADASPLEAGTYSFNGVLGSLAGGLEADAQGGFTLTVEEEISPYQTLILILE